MNVHLTDNPRPAACERARLWATLLPDGELSLFERRLLDAHCARCTECKALLEDVRSFTVIVRDTPLTEMTEHVRVSTSRLRSWRPAAAAFASGGAAAFALALALWVGPQVRPGQTATQIVSVPTIIVTPESRSVETQAIWDLKRDRGLAHNTPVTTPATRRMGLVLQ